MRDPSCVWVFGGSQGIGRAVAGAYARRGARIGLFARRLAPLEEAAKEIGTAHGATVQGWVADVEDPLAVAHACDEAARALGAPELVVNCAGRARPARFAELTVDDLRATLRANLEGTWNVVQSALPHLEAGGGTIVNTASLAGLIGVYGYSDYAASKFAVIGLSEVLRQELAARGVDVRVLCPPDVDTPGFAEENRSKPPETAAISETGALLSPEQVAAELLRGLRGRRFLLIPGRSARWLARAKRLAPGLVERIIAGQLRRHARR
ncbi:MAG: short-chain dehydrogenase [Deltaproteobacteria bacterium]|nr:short-chain dehydrogenase [Deltaproteobacteria bacterium]